MISFYTYLAAFPWLPTVLSAVAAFALGIFWYHPKVLGTRWLEARGNKAVLKQPTWLSLIYIFLLWLLAAAFYSFMAELLDSDSAASYIGLACLLWVAFAMPPTVMGSLYTGYPFQAVAIDMAYQLAGYYVFALVHLALKVAFVTVAHH